MKKYYGVTKRMIAKQFARSIFLVFARAKGGGALALASEDESAEKKAPNAPSEKVTVGNAEATNITVENGATLANRRFFASFLPTMNRW